MSPTLLRAGFWRSAVSSGPALVSTASTQSNRRRRSIGSGLSEASGRHSKPGAAGRAGDVNARALSGLGVNQCISRRTFAKTGSRFSTGADSRANTRLADYSGTGRVTGQPRPVPDRCRTTRHRARCVLISHAPIRSDTNWPRWPNALSFQGPHQYISPSLYPTNEQGEVGANVELITVILGQEGRVIDDVA